MRRVPSYSEAKEMQSEAEARKGQGSRQRKPDAARLS